jgi:RimJ/RimL family protein N-acetyltransferase
LNSTILTDSQRLEVRLPVENDRARFVELFCDADFMVFSGEVYDVAFANLRFDDMLARAAELPFAKQPIVEQSSGLVVGYAGVNWCEFEGVRWLEFGWRLVREARGRGYATEAARAVLDIAAATFAGEILCIIDPDNTPSRRVADKLGFAYWKRATWDGEVVDLLRIQVGALKDSA